MANKYKTLLIGESWMIQTVETKGADTFSVGAYGEGVQYIRPVLSQGDFEFTHMPCHRVTEDFPKTAAELARFDAIIISDVGANTFLLPVETFSHSQKSPNKLQILKDYVLSGGGLCMCGGYLSFMGIEGKGKYHGSLLEEVLPVNFLSGDDRMEHPEGLRVPVDPSAHPILRGLPDSLDGILGYNRALPKDGCSVLAAVEGDPFLTIGTFGKGRSAALATDLAPHWASPAFCESPAYKILWQNLVLWLSGAL